MSEQLYVALRDKDEDPDDLKLIQVAVAKQDIGDSITIVAASSCEEGGSYSNFYGVYRMDEYNESVIEVIEELDHFDDSEMFQNQLEELDQFLYVNVFYDEDYDCLRVDENHYDLIEDGKFDIDFDWANEAHIEASKNWEINYKWQ